MVLPICKSGNDDLDNALTPKQRRKKPYDPSELSDLEKRAVNLARQNELNQRYYKKYESQRVQSEAKIKQTTEEIYWQRAARAANVLPHKSAALEQTLIARITRAIKAAPGGVEEFLVNGLNQNVSTLGLPKGAAESVRSTLIYNRRLAEGIVENVTKMRGLKKLREITNNLRETGKAVGVSKQDMDEVTALAVELSQLNARRAAYGIGSPADVLNMKRVERLDKRLQGMGFNLTRREEIYQQALDLGNVLQEARSLALAFDVNVGYVENLGYFARMMTPEAKGWFDNIMDVDDFFDLPQAGKALNVNAAFNKSRNTFYFIPQDVPLMASKLGIGVDELLPMLDEPKEITKFLHESLSTAELDDLADVGLLAKLPMTMDEVSDYLLTQYGDDLPFKGMKDIFFTDPEKVAAMYADNIQRAVGESGMIRTIFKDGIDNGWGVADIEFRQMTPTLQREFKKISPDDIKKYVPDYAGTETMYVHRLVHDTWKSISDIAVDPSKHGAIAGFFNYVNSIFTRSLLATPQFVMRVGYSSMVALGAAGGNIFRAPEALFDLQRVTSRGIDDALENTIKSYKIGAKELTEKELFEEFLYTLPKGYNPIMPGVKTEQFGAGELMQRLMNVPGQLNYYKQYTQAFFGTHPAKVASLWADAIKKGNEGLMSPLMSAGAFVEASMRWAAFKTIADIRTSSKIGAFVGSLGTNPRTFDSAQSMAAHINDYFFPFDDVGYVTSFASRYIRPFAIFAMNNPPAVVRHIIRNPQSFINYNRLRSLQNGAAYQDKDLNEGSVPDYVQRSGPLFMYKDGDKWATLLTNNFDQIGDGANYVFKELPEELQYMNGWYVGTSDKQRTRLQEKLDSKRWFQRMMQETLPVYRNATELLTGVDSASGRPIDLGPGQERESFLFWQPDPRIKWLLSSYSPIEWIDRVNPGEIFGTPSSLDTRTQKPIPGFEAKRGLFGNVRTQRQIDKYDPMSQSLLLRGLRLGGFAVRIIDVAREHQRTWRDINDTQALLFKEMSSANRVITNNPDLSDQNKVDLYFILDDKKLTYEQKVEKVRALHPAASEDFVRRAQVATDLAFTWTQLEFDRRRVEAYMLENKVPPTEIATKMRDINIEDIPALEDSQAADILQKLANQMGLKENVNR